MPASLGDCVWLGNATRIYGLLFTGVVALASSHCCRSDGRIRINLAESRRARSRPAAISFLTKRGIASRYSASWSTVQGLETTGSVRRGIVLIGNFGTYYTKSHLTAFLNENRNRYVLLWTVLSIY